MRFTASPVGGRITPLPSNEFYQSPFDGRWVDVDETEVFRLIDMQRERIFGTHGKAVPVDGKCGKLKMHETKLIEFNPTKIVCACGMAFPSWEAYGTHVDDAIAAPVETSAQTVCDVLADHLGDLDVESGFHVSYTDRGRVRCDCGGEYNDLHAWRVHVAETLLKALGKDESC